MPVSTGIKASLVTPQDGVKWADAVVMHDFCSWVGEAQAKPNLVVFHGWEGVFPPDPTVVKRRQEIALAARATVAVGAFIPKWYGHTVDRVIWGGVDLPGGDEPQKDDHLAVWVGHLEPYTCCLEVIETAVKRGFRVDVYGDGSLRVPLEQLRDSLGASVILRGYYSEAAPFFSRAHLALPSGFLSYLEALVRGRVCLVGAHQPLKLDYWQSHPHPPLVLHQGQVSEYSCLWEEAWVWARQQTWGRVADIYEELLN